jgi:hypothetical protein
MKLTDLLSRSKTGLDKKIIDQSSFFRQSKFIQFSNNRWCLVLFDESPKKKKHDYRGCG